MLSQRGLGYISFIIALILLPSAASLVYYNVSGDPTIRPLGITREALRRFNKAFGYFEIEARVEYDPTRPGGVSETRLTLALTRAFSAKGVESYVTYREVPGVGGTRITYFVGPSVIGPYPQARAAEGINAAVQAYRMKYPYQP